MVMFDQLTTYYEDYLNGVYDCIDRIVISAYFPLTVTPGGFRTWWNKLEGSEEKLDNSHLMRMAGRFSRRLRAYASTNKIPVIYCKRGERKHEIAEKYIPTDSNFHGVFLILVNRSPAPIWDIKKSKSGIIRNISRKKNLEYVNHYSFHIIDRQWGHITIKISGHPPFGSLIILNGHEYVAYKAKNENLVFNKDGNCFTRVSSDIQLRRIADTLCFSNAVGQLTQVCNRWIYSCLYFALTPEQQKKTGFCYNYSVLQMEYSRNLIFKRGVIMEQVFDSIIDHTRSKLNIKTVKTIFGSKHRPSRKKMNAKTSRYESVVEKPSYNMTVFRIHYDKITSKIYTKGEHILRTEIVVHNSKQLKCGRSISKFPEMAFKLKTILNSFLNSLQYADISFISSINLDKLNTPSKLGNVIVGGIDIQKPRIRSVLKCILELSLNPLGFRLSDVVKIMKITNPEYSLRHAAYDLRKLRGKNIIQKINKSRSYKATPHGLKAISALLIIREKVIKPVLEGVCKPKRGKKIKVQNNIDLLYNKICFDMNDLFKTMGIVV
jgi:hypothetical protein